MWPTLLALRALGGSGRIDEINEEVIRAEAFSEDQIALKQTDHVSLTVIEYRLAWSRSLLKNIGAIESLN